MTRLWIDISNTPQVQFFAPLVQELQKGGRFKPTITVREKNETVELSRLRGLQAKAIGRDFETSVFKAGAMVTRTLWLAGMMPEYDLSLSLENPMPLPVSKLRRKTHVLVLDNDLKLEERNVSQRLETWVKKTAPRVIAPKAMEAAVREHLPHCDLVTFDGIKEDVHVHGFKPSARPAEFPEAPYVVLRPEAFESKYVEHPESLVPHLVRGFTSYGMHVVLLDRQDRYGVAAGNPLVHIPTRAVDGLQLIHHSHAILTGSGTMAREGVALGRPSVSFFPGRRLLAVDRALCDEGRMLHSRSVDEIIHWVMRNDGSRILPRGTRSVEVLRTVVSTLDSAAEVDK